MYLAIVIMILLVIISIKIIARKHRRRVELRWDIDHELRSIERAALDGTSCNIKSLRVKYTDKQLQPYEERIKVSQSAYKRVFDLQKERADKLLIQLAEFRLEPDTNRRLELGHALWELWVNKLSFLYSAEFQEEYNSQHAALVVELNDLMMQQYSELLEQAPTSEQHFAQLQTLIDSSRKSNKRPWQNELPWPQNWVELVHAHVPNPSLSSYGYVSWRGEVIADQYPENGELRLRAIRAADESDVAQAKLILAYCNFDPHYLQMVEPQLRVELGRLIDRHNQSHVSSQRPPI